MFSIAAINDTESKDQWEPLAPTKEAQEFHLSQTYHDGLLKLEAKEYDKARELLESVLKDPIIANAQVESSASDSHLQQLRFLALKNLATVFLEQGPDHYDSALSCYLQAIEIDAKDSVVWNHLGTLSCSMGMLSISRWAFEQGLLCSPNNWNCMEKLLEVVIAIGDEVACLSVAELILRHWPSHSRALHVKRVIEETDSVPFALKGIDKLEPKHVRLKFLGKRKASEENHEGVGCKKLKESLELKLPEASWVALTDALLKILRPLSENASISGDIPVTIQLPSSSDIVMQDLKKEHPVTPDAKTTPNRDCIAENEKAVVVKEKEAISSEEHPQERRSTRLERLRSHKPGKDEIDFDNNKDPTRRIFQYLETFILDKQEIKGSASSLSSCSDQGNSLSEHSDVASFVRETSKNHGAYHMGHLLLEHAACNIHRSQDVFVKLLELEKLTRCWGRDRKPECSLFLAELYNELGSSSFNFPNQSASVSEASYHVCKIIESVALDFSLHFKNISWKESYSSSKSFQGKDSNSRDVLLDNPLFSQKRLFWIRYFWLSGQLSILEGKKAKALEEFCMSLSLLEKKDGMDDSPCTVKLTHCRSNRELNIDRVLHQMNLLKIDFLLKKTIPEMMEKETYTECIDLLAPLLFSTKDVLPGPAADTKDEGITVVELSVLDILIKACQKTKPMDINVYLNCHRRKLQILMALSGIDEPLASCRFLYQKAGSDLLSAPCGSSRETLNGNWSCLVAKEVKAISQCVSKVKNFIDQSINPNGRIIPTASITDMQSLLLTVMLNIARQFLSTKSSELVNSDQTEEEQRRCLLDAAIAFCKIQHLDSTVPTKTQVELIVGVHDLLAEYGLCCAGADTEAEEGTFLRFAIKHLLALDMKFKSNSNSSNGEVTLSDQTSENELRPRVLDVDMDKQEKDEAISMKEDVSELKTSKSPLSTPVPGKGYKAQESDGNRKTEKVERESDQLPECGNELDEEKEELELSIDNALDQCFYCLYGLNLRGDSSYEDDLALHKNTSRGDYQTKEQCADVFQYLLPYAKSSSRTGLVKLRRVLRAIRKHFMQPPDDILAGNVIDKFLDDQNLCENTLSDEAGSDGFLETMTKLIFAGFGNLKQYKASLFRSSDPYMDVYRNLYYFLAQSEEISATDKWPGFVLTKEGEEFIQQNANLVKYDLLYNPLRFESWQKLANIYDEEVDLLLNDGSKHINVTGWRKNATLPQRVEASRRRSRHCLLMSLALAKTPNQQCEIHELLALVYYDSLQNVVPFYDQRSVVPTKDTGWEMFCENSLKHFKKAFRHRQDWSHAFYIGKLSEKLGYSYEISLSYYDKAIALNPSAVDPVYRMHASRLKLLNTCGKKNLEALKILATYCFDESIKNTALTIIGTMASETSHLPEEIKDGNLKVNTAKKGEGSIQMEGVWHMLYNDSLSALEICVEGDLKHFHKARYMLAQGLYRRGGSSDLQKARDELSFCFKSSRSSFTINMWEIDGMVKKGRRKTPGLAGNKKALEVNLPESSRKFITCIRKYLLFYLQLLEETGDTSTLERAYISLRSDKRFSLCIEDLVPVAIGRYIKTLISWMGQGESPGSGTKISLDSQLEKIFSLFMEQGNLWLEICNLPEIRSPETTDSSLYGYLHQYIISLELNSRIEILETINERLRKRFKNLKLSNSNSARVGRHASIAWCRSLIIALASITQDTVPKDAQTLNPTYGMLENRRLLCVDVQTKEFWSSSFEDSTQLQSLEAKWEPVLSKIKNVMTVRKASDENLDTANFLLRSCYNFYRDTSCVTVPSGVNLYLVPPQSVSGGQFRLGMEGIEVVEVSVPRKLLLWAYTLLHGHGASISSVVKYMEDNVKPKMKRGGASSSMTPTAHTGGSKDVSSHGGSIEHEAVSKIVQVAASNSLAETGSTRGMNPKASTTDNQKGLFVAPQLQHCNNSAAEKKSAGNGDDPAQA